MAFYTLSAPGSGNDLFCSTFGFLFFLFFFLCFLSSKLIRKVCNNTKSNLQPTSLYSLYTPDPSSIKNPPSWADLKRSLQPGPARCAVSWNPMCLPCVSLFELSYWLSEKEKRKDIYPSLYNTVEAVSIACVCVLCHAKNSKKKKKSGHVWFFLRRGTLCTLRYVYNRVCFIWLGSWPERFETIGGSVYIGGITREKHIIESMPITRYVRIYRDYYMWPPPVPFLHSTGFFFFFYCSCLFVLFFLRHILWGTLVAALPYSAYNLR